MRVMAINTEDRKKEDGHIKKTKKVMRGGQNMLKDGFKIISATTMTV